MYPIRLVILLILLSLRISAQPIRKILIIDTARDLTGQFHAIALASIDSVYSSDAITLDTVAPNYYAIEHRRFVNRLSPNVYPEHFPNVVMPITLRVPTSDLVLPLDDSGGHIRLKDVFLSSADTIRINRLTIYHNCLPDSLKLKTLWYRNSNDSAETKTFIRSKLDVKTLYKECSSTYPESSSIIVNGKNYTFPIHSASVPDAGIWYCNGHGRMSKWRERRYENRIRTGKPYTYLSGHEQRVKSKLVAEVTIK